MHVYSREIKKSLKNDAYVVGLWLHPQATAGPTM